MPDYRTSWAQEIWDPDLNHRRTVEYSLAETDEHLKCEVTVPALRGLKEITNQGPIQATVLNHQLMKSSILMKIPPAICVGKWFPAPAAHKNHPGSSYKARLPGPHARPVGSEHPGGRASSPKLFKSSPGDSNVQPGLGAMTKMGVEGPPLSGEPTWPSSWHPSMQAAKAFYKGPSAHKHLEGRHCVPTIMLVSSTAPTERNRWVTENHRNTGLAGTRLVIVFSVSAALFRVLGGSMECLGMEVEMQVTG